ncbi:hypothetical protein [Olivibacter ginsenosidimutans]
MSNSIFFKSAIISLICVFAALILSIFVFKEAYYAHFDFTDDDKVKISTTINALSTPIISLISVILLYITLSKQIESNYFQKKSKNLDLVLVMYNQLQVEYENFSYTKKGTSTTRGVTTSYENHFKGADALRENLASFRIKPEKFGPSYQSDKIIRLVHSFTFLENIITTMDLEEESRNLLNRNMESFYKTSFRPVFLSLAYLLRSNTNSYSKELIDFVTSQERKQKQDFDIKSYKKEGDLFGDYYNS